MGLSLSLSLSQRHVQVLSHSQLQTLTLLLKPLKDGWQGPAATGLEGIKVADEILKRKNATGVLIGSLVQTIQNKAALKSEVKGHKDVDVMVTGDDFRLSEPFEGGIDWWLEKKGTIKSASTATVIESTGKWWENGNGVVLQFGVQKNQTNVNPGLYIPTKDWIIAMRMAEMRANYTRLSRGGILDDDYVEAAENRLRNTIRIGIMPQIKADFAHALLIDKKSNLFSVVEKSVIEAQATTHEQRI